MTSRKRLEDTDRVPLIKYIRRDILHIHPRFFLITILHILAMNCPIFKLRNVLYKLRGTKLERNITIGNLVFMDDLYPELITIKENADIGPRVTILTHDTVFRHVNSDHAAIRYSEVVVGKNCYIGAGTIILPGVIIGNDCIIGAGSVVTKSIPPGNVAMGVPAKVVCTTEEWSRNHLVNE
jgi:maltose O-acetyltransferase